MNRANECSALSLRNVVFLLAGVLAISACAKDRAVGLASNIEIAELTALPAPEYVSAQTIGPEQSIAIIAVCFVVKIIVKYNRDDLCHRA